MIAAFAILLYRKGESMKVIKISKGNGKSRTIYAPDKKEKFRLQLLLSRLNEKQLRLCDTSITHGFVPGRSPVTNAQAHIGHQYTLSMDLTDFFDHVTPNKVSQYLSQEELDFCFVDGAARQGLPTSPAIANIAAIKLDKAIVKWIDKRMKNVVYTRYADDLSFSFDSRGLISPLKKAIPQIVSKCGFKINPKKTHLQTASFGRRVICGVAVDDNNIYPTRKVRRKLRAAKHQGNKNQIKGLYEWCALKEPKEKDLKQLQMNNTLEDFCKAHKLKLPPKKDRKMKLKLIPESRLDSEENAFILNDPLYFLGMSSFTTGWTSCMALGKSRAQGTVAWLYHPGVSIAAILSDTQKSIKGFSRSKMKARTLIYKLNNGDLVHGRIYGNSEDCKKLSNILAENNIPKISSIHQGRTVDGYIPIIKLPYLDNVSATKVRMTNGKQRYKLKIK
jgi:hypothetical protein